jgi:hypothetical protein
MRRGSCARIAATHAVAPVRTVMKSRRLIRSPRQSARRDVLSSIRRGACAKLHRTRRHNISLPYFYGDRDGIDCRRRYCIRCIGIDDVYHYSANGRFWHVAAITVWLRSSPLLTHSRHSGATCLAWWRSLATGEGVMRLKTTSDGIRRRRPNNSRPSEGRYHVN